MKLQGEKIRMSQVWKDDRVVPGTRVKVTVKNEQDEEAWKTLEEGSRVIVSGKSRGKGFQGVVKRHGFKGGPKTHGQKDRLRAPGSIGVTATQRVIKGKKMAGHMGNVRVTTKGLLVVERDDKTREVFIKGAVPGVPGGTVEIRFEKKT